MDWRTGLLVLTCVFYADSFSKYGRTCKDIGCLNSEVCVLAEDPCSFGHTRDCGTYPTCKKKTAVGGSNAEPQSSVPKPTPARPQPPRDFDSAPNYPPPAPPAAPAGSPYGNPYGGSPYGGSSNNGGNSNNGGSSYGGGSPYGGSSPYGGGSPYGSNTNGGSNYPGGSPYGGSPYGNTNGGSPYGGGSHGGNSPYGGSSPYGGTNNRGGNSPYGGSSSGGSGGTLDSIFNTLNKYASGGQGGSGSGGSGQGQGLSNIFGSILGNLSKNGGINNLFNTRPIMENPNYASPSNSRSSNSNYPSSGYPQSNQPAQNRNYGQSHGKPNAASTYKPATYGWNVGVILVLLYLTQEYFCGVTHG